MVAAALVGAFGPASGAAPRDSEPRFPTHWQGDEETAFEAHICSWSYIDACSEDMQRWMVKSLLTDASKLFPAMKQNALALLDPQPGERVLDVACGIGTHCSTALVAQWAVCARVRVRSSLLRPGIAQATMCAPLPT